MTEKVRYRVDRLPQWVLAYLKTEDGTGMMQAQHILEQYLNEQAECGYRYCGMVESSGGVPLVVFEEIPD